ncbi:MAG: hypothetical protein J2O44_02535 [Porphyrobacter sp.]|nr:hypothetical protein [Porphyrobacter sp.]
MTIKKLIPAALAIAALASAIPAIAAHDRGANTKGEAKLAQILAGRVPGKPVRCLDSFQRRNLEVVDRTALVFKDGNTYYVNRPAGANFLTWSDVPVFKIWGDQLCSLDTVHLRDRSSGMPGATLSLSEFVPYRRAG